MIQRIVQWLLRNRVLQHILFWSLSFYVLARFFAYEETISRADVVYTLLFHISLLITVYINLLILIPIFLKQGKYIIYLVLLIFTLSGGAWINEATFNYIGDWLFPGYYFISYYEWRDLAQFMLIYLAASTLLKLSKAWFWVNEAEGRLRALQSEKLDAELNALKAQLDPHFLFNSLNSLYSLALEGDIRTPEAILKLSHNMRYMLYECNTPQVTLAKEIEYIRNYLDLQRLRSQPHHIVNFNTEIPNPRQPIAPLLFIPFIENAFKHGDRHKIDIQLIAKEKMIHLSVHNQKKAPQPELEQAYQGIGLQNIRRRLELLYPNHHYLNVKDNAHSFTIHLQIFII